MGLLYVLWGRTYHAWVDYILICRLRTYEENAAKEMTVRHIRVGL
jgi:hypothetical protein